MLDRSTPNLFAPSLTDELNPSVAEPATGSPPPASSPPRRSAQAAYRRSLHSFTRRLRPRATLSAIALTVLVLRAVTGCGQSTTRVVSHQARVIAKRSPAQTRPYAARDSHESRVARMPSIGAAAAHAVHSSVPSGPAVTASSPGEAASAPVPAAVPQATSSTTVPTEPSHQSEAGDEFGFER